MVIDSDIICNGCGDPIQTTLGTRIDPPEILNAAYCAECLRIYHILCLPMGGKCRRCQEETVIKKAEARKDELDRRKKRFT